MGSRHQLFWVSQVPPGCRHRTDPGDVTGKVLSLGMGGKEEPWARVTQPWGCSSLGSAAATRPARRAGNNKQTAAGTGNDLGKIGAVFSDEAANCLRRGPSRPPQGCEGNPSSPTSAQDVKAADFGCFAGHNANLVSAAGTFKNPQNPGHVCKCHRETAHCGDIPVPSPLPWYISCPAAFSGLPLGSRKGFGVRARGKQPQTEVGGCRSPSLQTCSVPFTLLLPALLLPWHHLLNPTSPSCTCKPGLVKPDLLWVF